MEGIEKINLMGYRLTSLSKERGSVQLELVNSRLHKKIKIWFEGVIFETFNSPVGGVVDYFSITASLGVKVLVTLRAQRKKTGDYKQLYVRMKDSTEENKREIIAGYTNIKYRNIVIP